MSCTLSSVNLQLKVDLGRAQRISWFLDLELDKAEGKGQYFHFLPKTGAYAKMWTLAFYFNELSMADLEIKDLQRLLK